MKLLERDVGRALGAGLYDTGEEVVRVVNGRAAWRRSPRALAGGRVDPDHGWAWTRADRMLVGSFGSVVPLAPGRRWLPYPTDRVAGVDPATGRGLWSRRGWLGCLPGDLELLIRCAGTGTILARNNRIIDRADVRLAISRIGPRSGRSVWSLPAAPWSWITEADRPWISLRSGEVAGQRGSAYVAIDLTDGSTRQVDGGTVGWCEVSIEYRDLSSYADDRRRIGGGHRPCRMDG